MAGHLNPMPGQKSIRLAKKGGGSSLTEAGFRRFQPSDPFASASLCGDKDRRTRKVIPGPFWLRRLLFCPGNKESGFKQEMIQFLLLKAER